MKKILRIVLIILGVVLILMISLPVLFKSKIESMVKEQINENLHASVDWSGFTLSLFRGFPNLSINLHQLSVVGLEPFRGDTLLGLERFELRVNPLGAFRQRILVKSVLLDRPLIHGIVLDDGAANWEIVPEGTPETEGPAQDMGEAERGTMTFSLERLAVRDGRILYDDAAMDLEASLGLVDLEMKGDFSMEETDLALSLDSRGIHVKQGGIRYMREATFGMDLVARANLVQNRYTLEKNEIRLNGLVLGAEGSIGMLEDGAMDLDLRVFSRETSFQTLLSMVPAIYLQDFESLETSGSLLLEGEVKGLMKDSLLPDARLTLEVSGGSFSYPGLPKEVSDVQIRLMVDYRGADRDATRVELDRFHMLLGGNPFDMKMLVEQPFSDMHVAGEALGRIDFGSLKDVIPLEGVNLQGRLETDLHWDTKISYIEQEQYERVDLDGTLVMENVLVETPEIPVPVDIQKMELAFNPRLVELVAMDLLMGNSDLHMEGKLSNFIPYLFSDRTISGSLVVRSRLLDANELMPESTGDEPQEAVGGEPGVELVAALPDSLAEPLRFRIPNDIDFGISLDMAKVTYDRMVFENIRGEVKVSGGVARLEGLELEVIEGDATASGTVDTRGEEAMVNLQLELMGVDIPSSYETFVTVERLAPMARYCQGSANVKMEYRSLLDASFNPLYESITGKGRVSTQGLQIYNLNSFVKLSELLKNEKFREMAPDEVDVQFTIMDGRVMVAPFAMNFDDSRITVSGSHGIDLTMDYQLDMRIAKSDLGAGARELMAGISLLAAGAGFQVNQSDYVNVKARITGTFNDPKITTDLSGNMRSAGASMKTAVEERIIQEVEKTEEKVREEAGQKAEEIISKAEAEADALIREAQQAGENLVKEAELQGDKLIKEAGSNPIKQAAARRGADELKKQAEKQSDNLVKEAESRAEEMIRQARAEAEKI